MEFLKNLFTKDNSIIGLCGFEETRESFAGETSEMQMKPRNHTWLEVQCELAETFQGKTALSPECRYTRVEKESEAASGGELLFDDLTSNLNRIFTDYNYAVPVNLMYKNREHLKNIFCS